MRWDFFHVYCSFVFPLLRTVHVISLFTEVSFGRVYLLEIYMVHLGCSVHWDNVSILFFGLHLPYGDITFPSLYWELVEFLLG